MSEHGSIIRSLSGRGAARNFHSFVINEIGTGIVGGQFPVGSILPNDGAMMGTYDVSRTVLREALKTLEAKGLVEARPKVGTRVAPRSRWSLFDPQVLSWFLAAGVDRAFLEDAFAVRVRLETEVADLAARHRTREQVRLLHYWLHQLEAARDLREPRLLAELEIHRVLAEASQNAFLRAVVPIVEFTIAARGLGEGEESGLAEQVAARHTALLDAVDHGDGARAVSEMAALVSADRERVGAGRAR